MSGWWLASYVLLWLLVVTSLLVLLVVLRQLGLVYLNTRGGLRLDIGQSVGTPIEFSAVDIDGRMVRFPSGSAAHNLLLFTSPECTLCHGALAALPAALAHRDLSAFVVDAGEPGESSAVRERTTKDVPVIPSLALQQKLGIDSMPYGIVTDTKGVIVGKSVVSHLDDMEDLLDRAVGADRSRHVEELTRIGGSR